MASCKGELAPLSEKLVRELFLSIWILCQARTLADVLMDRVQRTIERQSRPLASDNTESENSLPSRGTFVLCPFWPGRMDISVAIASLLLRVVHAANQPL
jgi:hypothetical protein